MEKRQRLLSLFIKKKEHYKELINKLNYCEIYVEHEYYHTCFGMMTQQVEFSIVNYKKLTIFLVKED